MAGADPYGRATDAAWAVGQVGDPEFAIILNTLSGDNDEHLQSMAKRSRAMLRRIGIYFSEGRPKEAWRPQPSLAN
jgi:hypothetical protein